MFSDFEELILTKEDTEILGKFFEHVKIDFDSQIAFHRFKKRFTTYLTHFMCSIKKQAFLEITAKEYEQFLIRIKKEFLSDWIISQFQKRLERLFEWLMIFYSDEDQLFFIPQVGNYQRISTLDNQSKIWILQYVSRTYTGKRKTKMKSYLFRLADYFKLKSWINLTRCDITQFVEKDIGIKKGENNYSNSFSIIRAFFTYIEVETKKSNINYQNPLKIELKSFNMLDEQSQYFIHRYLASYGKKSKSTRRYSVLPFFEFAKKSSIFEIDSYIVDEYIDKINSDETLTLKTKENNLSLVYAFFDWFENRIKRDHKIIKERGRFLNPFPKLKYINLSPDLVKPKKKRNKKLSIEEMKNLLEYSFHNNRQIYRCLVLLTFCGMRISEAVTIKIEDIDLHLRNLKTGVEEGARKSNKKGEEPLYFCFPPEISNILFEQINYVKYSYGNETKWLFPDNDNPFNYVEERKIQKYLRNYSKTTQTDNYTHIFRHTLSKRRFNAGVSQKDMELLSCHVSSSTELRTYSRDESEEGLKYRVKVYDKTLPSEYREVLNYIAVLE
jgi:integrase